MTYSGAESTTIGPGCLTAVFGMGTGVALWVWAPTNPPPRLFIEVEKFYFSTIYTRSGTPHVHAGLRAVTFSFRVSVGIEVILPGSDRS